MSTYDAVLPGPGFSLELRGDQRKVGDLDQDSWPDDPVATEQIDRRAVMFGLGLTRSWGLSVGARQVQETLRLPAVFDAKGELVEPERVVKGPDRLNVTYALSVGLLRTAPFSLGLSVFGSAYHKQKPKLAAGLNDQLGYQPSYSLALKPHYGVMLHSALRLGPAVDLFINGGDRYHNNEQIGVYNLRHEPLIESQLAWRPLPFLELAAGYEARWLQMYSKKSRGGEGVTSWRHDAAMSYGATLSFAGIWLEGFARQPINGEKSWAATSPTLGVAVGFRFGASHNRKLRRPVAARPKARNRVGTMPKPPARARPHGTVKPTPAKRNAKPAQPAVIGDIREAERIAAKARREQALRDQREVAAEQKRVAAERKARLQRLEQEQNEQFPEIDNLPDVTDQEYFWNGLED